MFFSWTGKKNVIFLGCGQNQVYQIRSGQDQAQTKPSKKRLPRAVFLSVKTLFFSMQDISIKPVSSKNLIVLFSRGLSLLLSHCTSNRYHELHLGLQLLIVTRLRLFRHGRRAKNIYSGAPPPQPLSALKLLDHLRENACSAQNCFTVYYRGSRFLYG